MSNLVPQSWREGVENLRSGVMDAFDRWLPHRSESKTLSRPESWPMAFFAHGGPAVDIAEDADSVRVTAELPGLSEKDFSVELREDHLVLKGEKKARHEDKKRDYYYSESSYGSFSRVIPLPCEVDGDKVVAKYKHGVLNITLPKTEAAKTTRVRET